jgi:hypothetical protein
MALAGLLLTGVHGRAQDRLVQVCVRDERGMAISDARVQAQGGAAESALTGSDGCASVHASPKSSVEVTKSGYARAVQDVGESGHVTVVIRGSN